MFFAKDLPGGTGQRTLGVNAVLKFINVVTNVGHGYDSSTGFFTAPANGTYSFNVIVCTYISHYANVGLVVNGVRVVNLYTYGSNDATSRTLSVSVLLKQGDKVQAMTDATQSNHYFYQHTYRTNSFGGTLVQLQH